MTLRPSIPDGAALPRRQFLVRLLLRRPLVHTLGFLLAALLTWLVWRSYQQPGFLLDFANLMLLC